MMHTKQNWGFTIVELLIVIVVIGILATISIAAYRGVTERAEDARILSTVSQFKKALGLYKAQNGEFPMPTSSLTCIGTRENYPASGSVAEGVCGWGAVDEDFNNKLKSAGVNSIPDGSLDKYSAHRVTSQRGINVYIHPDGQTAELVYIEGLDKDCLQGFSFNGGGGPTHKQCSLEYS